MGAKGPDPAAKDLVARLWTIYYDPLGAPKRYVVRGSSVVRGALFPIPDEKAYAVTTLEIARSLLPPGLHNLGRDPRDEPAIVETWI